MTKSRIKKQTANTGVVEETCVAVWAIMWYPMILKEQSTDLSPQNEAGEARTGRARGKVQPCCSSRPLSTTSWLSEGTNTVLVEYEAKTSRAPGAEELER